MSAAVETQDERERRIHMTQWSIRWMRENITPAETLDESWEPRFDAAYEAEYVRVMSARREMEMVVNPLRHDKP